jgi:formylglycine-generating enzyme required for sulfatase activity
VHARAGVPAWATRSGSDRFGPWIELEVQATRQRFRRCPAGTFLVGSPDDEEGREAGEGLHRVTLAHAFWLADTECTQLLWSTVMGSNPSSTPGSELPVDQVSWQACQEFCQRLGERAHGAHARLPSEAEWEAACRAGSRGPFSGGAEPAAVAWYAANSGAAMHLVATRQANSLGLYDCQGNVWEWCQECDPGYPDRPPVAGEAVLRGGAWSSALRACRAANRNLRPDGEGFLGSGLRVVLDDQ